MAAYRNVGLVNSPNTNNNNNSTANNHHLSSTLNRDGYDYPSNKYNQPQNYKSVTMPKNHYQNTTVTSKDDETNYLQASGTYDPEQNSNEPTKRANNPNGKFSIQKMIRQGFTSWRARKKPSSASSSSSTPPPITSANTAYANSPTPPPPSSTGRYVTTEDDHLAQIPPPTAARSLSVDAISSNSSPKRIIVTEPVNFTSARPNTADNVTVDFDRPPTAARTQASSPWTSSSTSTTTTNTMTTPSVTSESMSQPTPVPITRILPVHFTGTSKIPVPRTTPPLPSTSLTSPPPRPPSTQTKPTETNHSTTPVTTNTTVTTTATITTNPPRIPPPGKNSFLLFLSKNRLMKLFFFSCT